MEHFVLGIDVGTTAVKTVLVSSEGYIKAEASAAHDLISCYPGWAEEDAEIWWKNVITTLSCLKKEEPDAMNEVRCISVSGMVPAMVLLDKNGTPLRKTIQQNDARTVNEIQEISERIDQDMLYQKTGGRTNQQHILPRLLWVKRNEPEVFSKIYTCLGSYDYIVYKLTGNLSIESNFALESGLFDICSGEILDNQLEAFGISPKIFPTVNKPMTVVGRTNGRDGCLQSGIPVLAGTADHVASTLSAGIVDAGDLLIKFGGAGDILFCTDEIKTDPRLFFDYHDIPGKYLLNGCMASSGSLVKWYVNNLLDLDDPDALRKLDQEAEALAPASDGLIILPYFLGEKTPIFDPLARGVMYGLTLSHTRAHIFRAILEAVIYGFRHHMDVLKELGCRPAHVIATDGGAKSRIWCQIAADILDCEVTAYPAHPGSSLGAAFLAGMSSGAFTEWKEIHRFLTRPKTFLPIKENVRVYTVAYQIYRQLYEQSKPLNEKERDLYG